MIRWSQFAGAEGDDARGAVFSACRNWRYLLWNVWDPTLPLPGLLGINPSYAGARDDDHTTRKLCGFGERLGWGGYLLGNPFALVSTDQRGLLTAPDPIGPENDYHLGLLLERSAFVVCAWGSGKSAPVRKMLKARLWSMRASLRDRQLMCFGTAADGAPRHPLVLGYDTPLVPWRAA